MKFRLRNFVSITITVGFISVAITGLLYFFGIKSNAVETVHVLFGLIFTLFIGFHIWYNFPSLKNYTVNKKSKGVKREMLLGTIFSLLLLTFMCFGGGVATALAESGRQLFSGKKNERREGIVFTEISTNEDKTGIPLEIIIQKNSGVIAPLIVIWAEESVTGKTENLLLPAKMINVPSTVDHLEDFQRPDIKKAITFSVFDGSVMRVFSNTKPDTIPNYTSSTPVNDFFLETNTTFKYPFSVYLEISYKGKSEVYQAVIDVSASKVFLLTSVKNLFIKNCILKIA